MNCPDCSASIPDQHVEFFKIHHANGATRCGRCHHKRRATGRPGVSLPAWLVDEIVCLLGRSDGVSDLARRTSKEIGCECKKEVKGAQGCVIDVIELCIYHQAQDVQRRADDVLGWLRQSGVKDA